MAAKKKSKGSAVKMMLRTCRADMTSHGEFRWPRPDEDLGHGLGVAVAPDWDPSPTCGGGLHGLLDGQGDGGLLSWDVDAVWLAVEIRKADIVAIDGDKVKVPDARVVFAGDRAGALAMLRACGVTGVLPGDTATAGNMGTATAGNRGTATAGNRGTATAGDRGTATAGDRGTATAGYGGTATAGYGGTATAGHGGTATAGDGGTATAGYGGTATAGYGGTATAGYGGTATAGYGGTATAGNRGTATAGDGGTATAGDGGTATAGDGGTATAGYGGTVLVRWWGGARYRVTVGYVGEGVEPNVAYRCDITGRLERAQ